MIKKIFITGTDTNVGKTIVSGILLKKASLLGYKTAGYKPVSSGRIKYKFESSKEKHKFLNQDVLILKNNSSVLLKYEEINPISFSGNLPPHILSLIQGKIIQKKYYL